VRDSFCKTGDRKAGNAGSGKEWGRKPGFGVDFAGGKRDEKAVAVYYAVLLHIYCMYTVSILHVYGILYSNGDTDR
jgi:hypothetical protein